MEKELIKCACGCGKERMRYDNRGRERTYISGHILSITKHKLGDVPWNKNLKGVMKSHRKGVLLVEEYGEERAKEISEKISRANKNRIINQETRRKLSNAHKGKKPWLTGLTKETDKKVMKMSQTKKGKNPWNSFKNIEHIKIKLSSSLKGRKKSEEHIQRMKQSLKGRDVWNKGLNSEIDNRVLSGVKHSLWQGGKSFEPYTPNFNKIFKEAIRERDNHACVMCNLFEDDCVILYKIRLHIHHVDYDKKNVFPQNCVSLCNRCHGTTNYNRQHWTTFFQSLLKERYGYEYTQDQKIILDFNGGCKQ